MENKDKQRILDLMSNAARELGVSADWYDTQHVQGLSELCRYAQKTVCDFIEVVGEECNTADEIDVMLDELKYEYFNRYKYLQSEHLEHLAELALSAYMSLGDITMLIELNK